jgi:hypothetical protein
MVEAPWSGPKRRSEDVIESGSRPTLVLNPPDDEQFRGVVEATVERGADWPSALEGVLRKRYPRAIVRSRELSGESSRTWYVYREGHWIRPGH